MDVICSLFYLNNHKPNLLYVWKMEHRVMWLHDIFIDFIVGNSPGFPLKSGVFSADFGCRVSCVRLAGSGTGATGARRLVDSPEEKRGPGAEDPIGSDSLPVATPPLSPRQRPSVILTITSRETAKAVRVATI